MSPVRASVFWLAAIVVLAIVGSLSAGALAAHQMFYDAYTQTPYSAAYAFPIRVVQAASPGWDVDIVVWSTLAAIAACGIALVASLSRLERGSTVALVASFAIACIVLSAFKIIQSSDVYFYVMYGRLYGVHGVNPYAFGDVTRLSDPLIAQILTFAGKVPFEDPYGPLWTLVAGLQSRLLGGADLFWSAWSFRAVAIIAAVAAVAGILYALKREPDTQRVRAAGRLAFHPLVLYECAVGGHNDMLMVAPAVWAFAIVDDLPLIAGLLAGCAIAVKYVAAIILPFLVVRARRSGWTGAILCLALAIIIPVLCARPFQTGAAGAQALASNGSRFAMSFEWLANMPIFAAGLGNVPAFNALPSVPVFGILSWARIVQLAALAVAGALVVIGTLLCLRRFDMRHVWRSITALLLALPSMHPWYGLWIIPAIACGGRWADYAWWFGVFVFGCYTVDTISGWMPQWLPIAATLAYLIAPVIIAKTTTTTSESAA